MFNLAARNMMVFNKLKLKKQKIYWREILAILLLLIGVYFLRKQRNELSAISGYLQHADLTWLIISAVVTALYIFFQSAMYVSSFRALHTRVSFKYAIELFLKRNLLGIFLPGGGVTALGYIPVNMKRLVKDKVKIHQASGIFAFAGMLSTFIVCLPVLFLNAGKQYSNTLIGFVILAMMIALVLVVFRMLREKGWLYHVIAKRFPRFARQVHELTAATVSRKPVYASIIHSVFVELCGIVHLYLAMLAVGAVPSLQAAGIAYIVSLILMVASPFLKGLGAIELSIVYILTQYGYDPAQSLAIALIYRFFEFWLPLAGGIISFLMKGRQLLMRLVPAVLIFFLGIVNILSVVTLPVVERLHIVRNFVPVKAIQSTNIFVLFIGITLLVTAAYLIKGLRNAWWIALSISFLSIPGNLIKALDYEEASIAFVVFITLLLTRKQYRVKSHPSQVSTGISAAFIALFAVMVYGFVGFYYLERNHFGIEFTWQQSVVNAIQGFFLLNPEDHQPLTRFAYFFIKSFHVLGALSWLFLLYSLIRPYLQTSADNPATRKKAKRLVALYGDSSVDYFKLTEDKLVFLSQEIEGFIAYDIAKNFAVVLGEPVCAHENKSALLQEFDAYCHQQGWKVAYYRVDENAIGYFTRLKKKSLLIGQEALLDVNSFELGGKSKKALRNALNSLSKKGFTTRICKAPQSDAFLQQLEQISTEWLHTYKRKEMVFAQGEFDTALLREHDIIATFDADNHPVAFLNIIPDFAPGECTYDLIRKTKAAPGGCMDALIIELIAYAKTNGLQTLNLGLVPLSGISQPQNPAEQVMKFAYHKIRRFRQYKGLREFKEKYATEWLNKYIIYENDFDLLQLPAALNKVMQPQNR